MAGGLSTLLRLQQAALPEGHATIGARLRLRGTATVSVPANGENQAFVRLLMPLTLGDLEGFWIEFMSGEFQPAATGLQIEATEVIWLDGNGAQVLPYGQLILTALVPGGGNSSFLFTPPLNPVSKRDLERFNQLAGRAGALPQPVNLQVTIQAKNTTAGAISFTLLLTVMLRHVQGLRET